VDNGHEFLGQVTGTGCTLGTTVSAMVAAFRSDVLVAALAGLVLFEIAAERAAVRDDVRGPGTFVPAFIDAWLAKAKIEALEVVDEGSA
jgi:thiamine-phosphate diphosphorylase/hydroxyethylthiazole kinase